MHVYSCINFDTYSNLLKLDPNAALVCDFNSQLRSVNVRASYVQLQPATGCAVNNSQNNEKK